MVRSSMEVGLFHSFFAKQAWVAAKFVCNIDHESIIRIWRGHQGLNRSKKGGNIERGFPSSLGRHIKAIEANATLGVDVRMINFGDEVNSGRFERILGRDVDLKLEDSAFVRSIGSSADLGV